MKPQIFFLIFAVSTSLLFGQQVYATHYDHLGIDDVWYWREYDTGGGSNEVDCLYSGGTFISDDGVDNIEFIVNDGGGTDKGYCLFIKTFNIADIQNVGGSNTFSFTFEHYSDLTPRRELISIMDGNYQQYYDYSNPNIFTDDSTFTTLATLNSLAPGSWGNLESATGGVTTDTWCDVSDVSGTDTMSCTIDNTEWGRATTSTISVIIWHGNVAGTTYGNFELQPESFSITNTPNGTLTWNWPETGAELTNWDLYGVAELELTGTKHDYGYFITFDPDVPDPPTNLIADERLSTIELDWVAPIFNGYDPITGYKIERESPIGGGFTTLVSNTGNTNTSYIDSTITPGQEYNYRVRAINSYGESAPSNESKDGVGTITDLTPDVDCSGNTTDFLLYDKGITTTTVTLCWNGAILNQTALLGYQINFTTPWGDPLTVVTGLNNTGDNATTRLIENLTPATKYSFRVQSWMNNTANNMTQILNVTTLPGGLELDDFTTPSQDNPFRWPWGFTQVDLGNNYTSLLVSYPTGTNATCIFDFQFARNNQTFYNISTVASGDGLDVANFTLQNPQNEVIYVTCYDEDDPDSEGRTIIRQNTFPLLTQIEGFRTGEYGTMGNFGIFDLVTFVVVIISMIGFNRVNSAVAVAFSFIVIFVSAAFGFIEPISSIMMGLVVIGVGFGIFMHHRNEASP